MVLFLRFRLHRARDGVAGGRGVPGHSRPAEKYSRSKCWWPASGINIFGTLPNWHTGQVIWEPFFWSWSWFWSRQATTDASSRRWCCVKDDDGDDGTGCDERRCYSRSCSVSIQTVGVVAGTSSVLPCPRTGRRPGYAWTVVGCGPGREGVLTSRVSLRFPALCSGFEETRTT